jgi:hypothetical protein
MRPYALHTKTGEDNKKTVRVVTYSLSLLWFSLVKIARRYMLPGEKNAQLLCCSIRNLLPSSKEGSGTWCLQFPHVNPCRQFVVYFSAHNYIRIFWEEHVYVTAGRVGSASVHPPCVSLDPPLLAKCLKRTFLNTEPAASRYTRERTSDRRRCYCLCLHQHRVSAMRSPGAEAPCPIRTIMFGRRSESPSFCLLFPALSSVSLSFIYILSRWPRKVRTVLI